MKNPAPTQFPINPYAIERWSPRAFSSKPVEKKKLQSLFEAARWSASAFNEQPWRFIVGIKGDAAYDKIVESLIDWNQQWAGHAPVLIMNLAKKTFSHNGKPNATFQYDLGQSVANIAVEAVYQGLHSHQMSGFDPEKARLLFHIPDDYQPTSVMAVGYYGHLANLPADMAESETRSRSRKNLNDLVFTDTFGNSTKLF
ncbi:MAG: nitroreductase family protein [Bacteroidales bacterium]|jgi:nitroreductase